MPNRDTIKIFDIQRYSLHDGNGIRTNIFIKGCPLRCKWCANPESQRFYSENVYSKSTCMNCGSCVEGCPQQTLSMDDWNREDCSHCMKCEAICPTASRRFVGKDRTIESVVDEVIKDHAFYKASGGGVTLSGGEPLAQPEATAKLAAELKKMGLHLAIETCGYAKWEKVEAVLKHCDQILYDIKEMCPIKHLEFTGVDNRLILDNARKAARLDSEFIIRVPVIGGYTNRIENIEKIAKFAVEIGAAEMHLLPFHRFGENKYEKSHMSYDCADAYIPSEVEMQSLVALAQSSGIKTKIGG
ncbi:MAG: glycyl-radical enzyme activating protein [Lentisphaeria bacterium]|nr:glycyl-radical enzyme activating protein [Lentisphaeria bacterium]